MTIMHHLTPYSIFRALFVVLNEDRPILDPYTDKINALKDVAFSYFRNGTFIIIYDVGLSEDMLKKTTKFKSKSKSMAFKSKSKSSKSRLKSNSGLEYYKSAKWLNFA